MVWRAGMKSRKVSSLDVSFDTATDTTALYYSNFMYPSTIKDQISFALDGISIRVNVDGPFWELEKELEKIQTLVHTDRFANGAIRSRHHFQARAKVLAWLVSFGGGEGGNEGEGEDSGSLILP
jgi:hypothetical protein